MSLNKALENMKFDSRLLDLNLRLGRLTQEEYDAHIKSLEDLEKNAEKIDIEDSTSTN